MSMARIIPEMTKAQIVAEHGSEAAAKVYAALRDALPGHVTMLCNGHITAFQSTRRVCAELTFVRPFIAITCPALNSIDEFSSISSTE